MTDAGQTKKLTAIENAIDELEKRTVGVEEVLAKLIARLRPIMRTEPPSPEGKEASIPVSRSDVAEALWRIEKRQVGIRDRIEVVLGLLDL